MACVDDHDRLALASASLRVQVREELLGLVGLLFI